MNLNEYSNVLPVEELGLNVSIDTLWLGAILEFFCEFLAFSASLPSSNADKELKTND